MDRLMCLIAHREAGGPAIPADVVKRNIGMNPDGFGIMWRDADGVRHLKFAPSEADEFMETLGRVDAAGVEYGAHWRKATHGAKDRTMAHPYPYVDVTGTPIVAMHNGVIDIRTDKDESDTHRFVHAVLAKMETGWWESDHLRYLVEAAIGWSRLLLMTPDETVVVNRKEWVSEGGIDYSCKPLWGTPKGLIGANTTAKEWKKKADVAVTVRKVEGPDPSPLPVPSAGNAGSAGSTGASEFGSPPNEWEQDQFGPFWEHAGHYVMKVPEPTVTDGGDSAGECACWDCGEEGEYYVIGGATFFDIRHVIEPVAVA